MTQRGQHTYAEIYSQPEIWKQTLEVFRANESALLKLWKSGNFERVLLTGCGSTYYLGQFGADLIQAQTAIPAQAISATELMLFPEAMLQSELKTLFITVSRSGTTRETVAAARNFREYGKGTTLTITCHSESLLAQEADFVLAIDEAREISRVQTRSFSSMALLLEAFALAISGRDATTILDPLPDILQNLLNNYADLSRSLGEQDQIKQFVFLGSGILYGLACEAMLKIAELSRLPSTAFHALEFMHGPKYMVTEHTLVIALLTNSIIDEEIIAVREAQERSATVLILVEKNDQTDLSQLANIVKLQTDLPLYASAILYLPLLQLLGYFQAVFHGYNPDTLGQ